MSWLRRDELGVRKHLASLRVHLGNVRGEGLPVAACFEEEGVETCPGRVDGDQVIDLTSVNATDVVALPRQVVLEETHVLFFLVSGYDLLL